MKQTAVQYLLDTLKPFSEHSDTYFHLHIETALEMEKEQIIEAYIGGICNFDNPERIEKQSEEYYNKNYKI